MQLVWIFIIILLRMSHGAGHIPASKYPERNIHADFVGIAELKREHAAQVDKFEDWARAKQWNKFHQSHYDWWAFPIPDASRRGTAYSVYAEEVAKLKEDPEFIKKYLRGCELLALSWGWDIHAAEPIRAPSKHQRWQDWPIRLFKCTKSLRWFGFVEQYSSMKKYGQKLLAEGHDFTFRKHDLTWLFNEDDDASLHSAGAESHKASPAVAHEEL